MSGASAARASTADARAELPLERALDLRRSLAPIAHGAGDPTFRFVGESAWWAMSTGRGPATLRLRIAGHRLVAEAWGAGSDAAIDEAAAIAGLDDDPGRLVPRHPVIADLSRRNPGLRLPATGRPWEALLPAICEQKVTGIEARRAYRAIVQAHGAPAPGPGQLRIAPEPQALAELPYFAFHPAGLERRRAETVRAAAAAMGRLASGSREQVAAHLAAVPGIGPWTLAEVTRIAWGDPDAISVGDYHLPNIVAWALAGEPRADDARMLVLLEPYRGQRGRVQRLLEVSGIEPPRRRPRMAPRRIHAL